MTTHDEIYKNKLIACANWAVENQQEDGGWVTFAYENPEHPYSSMAQGEGISMLIRAHIVSNDERYLSAIHNAKEFMLKSIYNGGTTEYGENYVLLYEYTSEPLVLNGWIFSYWGLHDYSIAVKDKAVEKTLNSTLKTMIKMLPKYDLGYWSRYDLTKRIASPFYHRLHIAQLKVMFDLTGEKVFETYASKWERYDKNLFCRSRAFLEKAIQKVFER